MKKKNRFHVLFVREIDLNCLCFTKVPVACRNRHVTMDENSVTQKALLPRSAGGGVKRSESKIDANQAYSV